MLEKNGGRLTKLSQQLWKGASIYIIGLSKEILKPGATTELTEAMIRFFPSLELSISEFPVNSSGWMLLVDATKGECRDAFRRIAENLGMGFKVLDTPTDLWFALKEISITLTQRGYGPSLAVVIEDPESEAPELPINRTWEQTLVRGHDKKGPSGSRPNNLKVFKRRKGQKYFGVKDFVLAQKDLLGRSWSEVEDEVLRRAKQAKLGNRKTSSFRTFFSRASSGRLQPSKRSLNKSA